MPGAYTFEYGTSGVRGIVNKHTLSDDDGTQIFEADFLVTAATDADMKTALDAAYAIAVDDQTLEVKVGTEVLIDVDPSVNTGFLQRATVTKVGSRADTARSALLRLRVAWEREPQVAARAGRRIADVAIAYDAARVREAVFSGIWTALAETAPAAGDEKTALEAYEDGRDAFWQTWIDAANDGSGSPLLSTTGRWQKIDEAFTPEDENKRGSFSARFREVFFSASPAPDAPGDPRHAAALMAGVYLSGTFSRSEPEGFGFAPSRSFEGINPVGTGSTSVSAPRPPLVFSVSANVSISRDTVDPNTGAPFTQDALSQAFVRPWVVETLKTMFGVSDVTFRALTFNDEDVATKSINVSATLVASGSPLITSFRESVQWTNDKRLSAAHVWDGIDDSYDLASGGREARLVHTVRATRLLSSPSEPTIFTRASGVEHERTVDGREGVILDALGRPTREHERNTTNVYLKVRTNVNNVPMTPAPLGVSPASGGSGSVVSAASRTGLNSDGT